jgi:hypothetical protein
MLSISDLLVSDGIVTGLYFYRHLWAKQAIIPEDGDWHETIGTTGGFL